MEEHKKCLKNLCRVCGRKATTRKHNKQKDPCKSVLLKVYGLSVDTESDDIYPPEVCNSCFLVLRRASIEGDSAPILSHHIWSPHTDSCQLCLARCSGGRPRKRKRGRPSDADSNYITRKFNRMISTLHTPKYTNFPLNKYLFLPSPFLNDLVCKCCQCVPNEPVEFLTCRHYVCLSCIQETNNFGQIHCPCNGSTLGPEQLIVPSALVLNMIGSLLVRCNKKCSEVMELRHFMSHIESDCSLTEVPPPSKITVQHILNHEPSRPPSIMETHTKRMLAEKLLPSGNEPVICRTSMGKV